MCALGGGRLAVPRVEHERSGGPAQIRRCGAAARDWPAASPGPARDGWRQAVGRPRRSSPASAPDWARARAGGVSGAHLGGAGAVCPGALSPCPLAAACRPDPGAPCPAATGSPGAERRARGNTPPARPACVDCASVPGASAAYAIGARGPSVSPSVYSPCPAPCPGPQQHHPASSLSVLLVRLSSRRRPSCPC